MTSRESVLRLLTIGARVAEEEAHELEEYFLETDQFHRIIAGEVDIVFGPKGSGKSAIYSSVLAKAAEMFDSSIFLVAGENPKGSTAFAGIKDDPPSSEDEFKAVWKLYVLSLISDVMTEYALSSSEAKQVRSVLAEMGLTKGGGGLSALLHNVVEYLSAVLRPQSLEGAIIFEPLSGIPTGLVGKITLREPSDLERAAGFVSIDQLLVIADSALEAANIEVWILFDRLDVAFEGSALIEARALRSLFRVYLDLLGFEHIQLKIFIRSDIWKTLTLEGFREASHITRTATITWTDVSLLNLIVRRLVKNDELLEFLNMEAEVALRDAHSQRDFLDRILPDRIPEKRSRPKTYDWILSRTKDGTGSTAPRELIHYLTESRNIQLAMIERGEHDQSETFLLSRQAIRSALAEVSQVRLEQTIYAEYPLLRHPISLLEHKKSSQTTASLSEIWEVSHVESSNLAARLLDIGFFESEGERSDPVFVVPHLYRPALEMT